MRPDRRVPPVLVAMQSPDARSPASAGQRCDNGQARVSGRHAHRLATNVSRHGRQLLRDVGGGRRRSGRPHADRYGRCGTVAVAGHSLSGDCGVQIECKCRKDLSTRYSEVKEILKQLRLITKFLVFLPSLVANRNPASLSVRALCSSTPATPCR